MTPVDDYPGGYPQFSALISAHSPFFICRQFRTVRSRLLLLKQDRISILEERLNNIDATEKKRIYLGKSRADKNTARIDVLAELEARISDYDQFLYHTNEILRSSQAPQRDVRSLVNWTQGTRSIEKQETSYLGYDRDLITLSPSQDDALSRLEVWIEDKVVSVMPGVLRGSSPDISRNPNIVINTYYQSRIRTIARVFLLTIIAALLLSPIALCSFIRLLWARMLVVFAFVLLYLVILLGLTKSKALELTLASTTYAAVLIVFVSGSGASKS